MTVNMLSSALLVAALLTVVTTSGAGAQSLAQVGGPANLPPAGYKGQQFVDNRGCVFVRAAIGGRVNYFARVDQRHKPICGMQPTGSVSAQAAVVAPGPLDVPQPAAPPAQAQVKVQVEVQIQAQAQTQAQTQAQIVPTQPAQPAAQPRGFNLAWLFGPAQRAPVPAAAAPVPAAAPVVANAIPLAVPVAAGPAYQGNVVATAAPGVQCYADAPKLETVKINGGTALVCTKGNGSTTGWRPPRVVDTTVAQAATKTTPALAAPVTTVPVTTVPVTTVPVTTVPVTTASVALLPVTAPTQSVQVAAVQATALPTVAAQVTAPTAALPIVALPVARSQAIPKPPKGWVPAWSDGRLNPLRGIGTAAGQAQQDAVWTRTVPMVLIGDPLPKRGGVAGVLGLRVKVSTMSAPEPVARSGLVLQIGSFGDPANATRTAARLSALGLPVSTTGTTRNGKTLQTLTAGPFASAAQAQVGLTTVHAAGFPDAFLR